MKINKTKILIKILVLFLLWRVGLFFVGYFADFLINYDPSFPYSVGLLDSFNLPRWLYSWGGFDGVHYISIVDHGYEKIALIQAFFPFYPFLIKIVGVFTNTLISGLLVSNISFILLLIIWFKFVHDSNPKIAWFALLVLLLFPTSLFFGAIYTESFFLTCVLLSFMFAQRKKYLLAAIFVAFASATRVIGVALIPALFFEIVFSDYDLIKNRKTLGKILVQKIKKWKTYLVPLTIISSGSVGLLFYMWYLKNHFGDPLYFFHVQSEFGGIREERIILYPQVIYRYLKLLLTVNPFNLKYFSYVQDFVVATFGLATLLYSVKKVRVSYVIFSLIAFILPTLTGTFSSMPRYILVCFPIYMVLATWAKESVFFKYSWYTISGVLLIINSILFIQGYWIA